MTTTPPFVLPQNADALDMLTCAVATYNQAVDEHGPVSPAAMDALQVLATLELARQLGGIAYRIGQTVQR